MDPFADSLSKIAKVASRVQLWLKGLPLSLTCGAAEVRAEVFFWWSSVTKSKIGWRLLAQSSDSNSLLPPKWMWRRTLSPPAYRKKLSKSNRRRFNNETQQSFHTLLNVPFAEKRECRAGGMTADWGSASKVEAVERVDQSKRSRTTTCF